MHVLPANNIVKTPQQYVVHCHGLPTAWVWLLHAEEIKHTSMVPATMYFMGFTTLHCNSHIGSINSIGNSVTCAGCPFALSSLLSATGQT